VIDEAHPILEVSLPFGRIRATVIVPPVTTAPVMALRIPPRRLLTLADLVERGSLAPAARDLLVGAVLGGETVLVAGAVSSGKTVLASALLSHLVAQRPEERVVVLEEGARELRLPEGSDATPLLSPAQAELPMREAQVQHRGDQPGQHAGDDGQPGRQIGIGAGDDQRRRHRAAQREAAVDGEIWKIQDAEGEVNPQGDQTVDEADLDRPEEGDIIHKFSRAFGGAVSSGKGRALTAPLPWPVQ
jgi:hypothetical protein